MDAAHRRWWQIFEVVFGLPLAVAGLLQIVIPWSLPFGAGAPVAAGIGAVTAIAGLTFVVLARRQFARFGQPTDPGRPTSQLVTTGVFAISRNPLYVGGVMVLAGFGLLFNLAWVLLLLVPSVFACNALLIAPEERYLGAKFNGAYQRYANTVCRWIGVRTGELSVPESGREFRE